MIKDYVFIPYPIYQYLMAKLDLFVIAAEEDVDREELLLCYNAQKGE